MTDQSTIDIFLEDNREMINTLESLNYKINSEIDIITQQSVLLKNYLNNNPANEKIKNVLVEKAGLVATLEQLLDKIQREKNKILKLEEAFLARVQKEQGLSSDYTKLPEIAETSGKVIFSLGRKPISHQDYIEVVSIVQKKYGLDNLIPIKIAEYGTVTEQIFVDDTNYPNYIFHAREVNSYGDIISARFTYRHYPNDYNRGNIKTFFEPPETLMNGFNKGLTVIDGKAVDFDDDDNYDDSPVRAGPSSTNQNTHASQLKTMANDLANMIGPDNDINQIERLINNMGAVAKQYYGELDDPNTGDTLIDAVLDADGNLPKTVETYRIQIPA